MATKQRYQNPILGDIIRLQNYARNAGASAILKEVAKIEIFYLNDNAKTPTNPDGRVLKATIVNHKGQPATEIYPYPSASSAEYWETQLTTDVNNWQIGKYIDKWHLVTDPSADFFGPAAVSDDEVAVTGSGAATLTLSSVNRKVRLNGITNAADTPVLAYTTFATDVDQSSPSPTALFFSDPLTIAGYIEDDVAEVSGYFYAYSNDGTTWTVVVDSNTGNAQRITAATATWDSDSYSFTFTWTWNSAPASYTAHFWYVEEWAIYDLDYNPSTPNPWDDLLDRSSNEYVSTVEHRFEISNEFWYSTPGPIFVDYNWNVEPAQYYVNSIGHLKVTASPSIEKIGQGYAALERYYYSLLARGNLTYDIWRLNDEGTGSRKIKEGTVDWHENNVGIVTIDTTQSPLNRPMEAWIKFYLEIEGQATVQSSRIFIQIIDDRRRGLS